MSDHSSQQAAPTEGAASPRSQDDVVEHAKAALEEYQRVKAEDSRIGEAINSANMAGDVLADTVVPELVAEVERLRAEKARALSEGDWA